MKNTMIDYSRHMFRVYGRDNCMVYDEYVEAYNAQEAADRARRWHESDGRDYQVEEVAKLMKGWK